MKQKKCIRCLVFKDLLEFYSKKNKNGRTYPSSYCKDCWTIYSRKYKKKPTREQKDVMNKRRREWRKNPKVKIRLKQLSKKSREKNIPTTMLNMARKRALKKGLEFNIIREDIIVPEVCPILEIPIKFGDKICYYNSPSLDRIDTTKGYIKGNIAVISMLANNMKNAATKEQIEIFCKNILNYIK